MDTTCQFLERNSTLKKVVFILFSADSYKVYEEYLKDLLA
jgi:O-acetyl-ADP-ribose deacetylase (regulator of RNase III)